MSRSRRHTPMIGLTGSSEKQDKREANRRFRRITREHLRQIEEDDDIPHDVGEVSDIYDFAKDGKMYFDRVEYQKLMRK